MRRRVIGFVRGGGSKAAAARRFSVGEVSVYRWLKPGGLNYERPGPRKSRKLGWGALRRQVEQHADLTQKERARRFGVSRHCVWYALQKMALRRKKILGYKKRDLLQRKRFLRLRERYVRRSVCR